MSAVPLFSVTYPGEYGDALIVELFDREWEAVRRCRALTAGGAFALVQSHDMAG